MRLATASASNINFGCRPHMSATELSPFREVTGKAGAICKATAPVGSPFFRARDDKTTRSELPDKLVRLLFQLSGLAVGFENQPTWRPLAELDDLAGRSSTSEFVEALSYTRARLASFLDFPVGWEHDDSQPGRADHFSAALAFLRRLPLVPNVPNAMINSDGCLGLFWQLPWLHAEAEFIDEHTFSLYSRELNGALRETYLPNVDIRSIDAAWFERELPRIFEQKPALSIAA